MVSKFKPILFIFLVISSFTVFSQATPLIYNYRDIPVYHRNEAVLENALREKQQILNLRKQDIYNQGTSILNLMNKIETRNNGLTESQYNFRKYFIEQVDEILTWDLAYGSNYNNAKNWLNSMENKVYTWI